MVPYVSEELRALARQFGEGDLECEVSEPVMCRKSSLSTVLYDCQSPKANDVK